MSYRIKTVARLTGVPRNTLLAWERRYSVVQPGRAANGYREYSDEDLATLTSVKQLIDRGYRISEAVQLVQEANTVGASDALLPGTRRLAVLHGSFADQLAQSGVAESVSVVRAAKNLDELRDPPLSLPAELLVADLALLGDDPRAGLSKALEAVGADTAVVLYSFATHSVIQGMVQIGARLVRWPAHAATVLQTVRSLLQLRESTAARDAEAAMVRARTLPTLKEGDPPAHRFTATELARLQERVSSIDCECPNHLASLVTALVAFEEYSARCQSKNSEDAVMHAYLGQKTSEARAVMEGALVELCKHEGIEV